MNCFCYCLYFIIILLAGDFPKAWSLLLEFIESSALCQNAEISLAALKSFQEILHIKQDPKDPKADEWKLIFHQKGNSGDASSGDAAMLRSLSTESEKFPQDDEVDGHDPMRMNTEVDTMSLWNDAWRVWLNIGTTVTTPPESNDKRDIYIPSQQFLSALMQIFPALYTHIKQKFVPAELQRLFTVLQRALSVPVHSDSTPFIMPVGDMALTPFQETVLGAIKVLQAVGVSFIN